MRKNEIIERAERFCHENRIDSYPVKIVDICKKLGFRVVEEPLKNNVSGYIFAQIGDNDDETVRKVVERYRSSKVIGINRNDSARRRRFTIAHELGHYILHREDETLFAHRYSGEKGGQESEANIFASVILMPAELVEQAVDELEIRLPGVIPAFVLVEYISREFAVSKDAAYVRLRNLNYI